MSHIKKAALCLCLVLLFAQSAAAKPANPYKVHTAKQPDNSTFGYMLRGDEYMSWCVSKIGGYNVIYDIYDKDTKAWYFAVLSDDKLVSSGVLYKDGATPPENALQNHVPAEKPEARLKSPSARAGRAASDDGQKRWAPRTEPLSGEKKALFIRVCFTNTRDLPTKVTSADQVKEIWGEGWTVQEYYADQSKGRLNVVPVSSDGQEIKIVEIQTTSDDFEALSDDNGESINLEGCHPDEHIYDDKDKSDNIRNIRYKNEVTVISEILKKVENINFADYDENEDNKISPDELVVYFIFEGYEKSEAGENGPSVWAHQASSTYNETGEPVEGEAVVVESESGVITLEKWALNGELADEDTKMPLVATVCHEMGHQLCALPDLYDTSGYNSGMGMFSLMASGTSGALKGEQSGSRPPNLDLWSRYYLGWEKPIATKAALQEKTINLGTQLYEEGISNTRGYRIEGPDSLPYQYYLVEVRDPSDDNWDGGLQYMMDMATNPGLDKFVAGALVIHVDETVGSGSLEYGNDINEYKSGTHQGVMGKWGDGESTAKGTSLGTQYSLWYKGNSKVKAIGITPDGIWWLQSNFFADAKQAYNAASVRTGISIYDFSEPSKNMTAKLKFKEQENNDSGGGLCGNMGFGSFALLAALPFIAMKKKRK